MSRTVHACIVSICSITVAGSSGGCGGTASDNGVAITVVVIVVIYMMMIMIGRTVIIVVMMVVIIKAQAYAKTNCKWNNWMIVGEWRIVSWIAVMSNKMIANGICKII